MTAAPKWASDRSLQTNHFITEFPESPVKRKMPGTCGAADNKVSLRLIRLEVRLHVYGEEFASMISQPFDRSRIAIE